MIVISENVKKTITFIKEQFDNSEYFKNNLAHKQYRLTHTYRVAAIGQKIAQGENLNEEALIIGCLLHDISYALGIESDEDWLNHGRKSATIARAFLESLDIKKDILEEVCYGIAIHVDDKADFLGERTPLALSIGDSDNIDRYDVYRLYETVKYSNFENISLDEQFNFVKKMQEKLNRLLNMEIATRTGKRLWQDKINYQISFYERLLKQLEYSFI